MLFMGMATQQRWYVLDCRSINSFLGILSHYSSFNIRCEMFLTENILKYAPVSKDMTKLYKPIIISYE